MADLISSSQISTFTGILGNHFDTFSRNRTRLITVSKEPIKSLVSSSTNPVYGYGDPSNLTSYTYTTVTGIFPAMLTYNLDQKTSELEEIKTNINIGEIRIKVEQSAKDFIEDGRKNEKIEFDGKSFDIITSDGMQYFLGLKYYIYKLENTL